MHYSWPWIAQRCHQVNNTLRGVNGLPLDRVTLGEGWVNRSQRSVFAIYARCLAVVSYDLPCIGQNQAPQAKLKSDHSLFWQNPAGYQVKMWQNKPILGQEFGVQRLTTYKMKATESTNSDGNYRDTTGPLVSQLPGGRHLWWCQGSHIACGFEGLGGPRTGDEDWADGSRWAERVRRNWLGMG